MRSALALIAWCLICNCPECPASSCKKSLIMRVAGRQFFSLPRTMTSVLASRRTQGAALVTSARATPDVTCSTRLRAWSLGGPVVPKPWIAVRLDFMSAPTLLLTVAYGWRHVLFLPSSTKLLPCQEECGALMIAVYRDSGRLP